MKKNKCHKCGKIIHVNFKNEKFEFSKNTFGINEFVIHKCQSKKAGWCNGNTMGSYPTARGSTPRPATKNPKAPSCGR